MSFDQTINEYFAPVADVVTSVVFYAVPVTETLEIRIILVWLAVCALFFTFYLGFINVRYFGHAINLVRGKYDEAENAPTKEGQISRFKALTTSLSGSVGLGNIAGVAVAISVGGPGATIWMILMGLFGMSSKFAEVMLGVKYRKYNDDGSISGGPMYYLKAGFENRGMPRAGCIIASIFAFACMCGAVGGGNMFQSNQAYQQLVHITGGEASMFADYGWAVGLVMAAMVALVIIGGIKSISLVASRLVPIMGGIYVAAGICVLIVFYYQIPAGLVAIFDGAFSMEAGIGGFLGGMLVGVQRAAFSNEAGLGSSAIVHSTAQTDEPVSQGFVGMLGPFVDTVVICTVTALVIVITGAYQDPDMAGGAINGVELTSRALESGISWFPYVLALTVFLFAFSTMITWAYYGVQSAEFLFGHNKIVETAFKLFFCFCVVVGAAVELSTLIDFSDAMILAMAFPNIVGLYLFAPEIKRDVQKYVQSVVKR